jgi:uncharacterized protein YrrD
MPEFTLNFQGNTVKVFLCRDGDWRHDAVFIYNNNKKSIKDKKIKTIMQYLYDEAYIKDRRTKYEIFDEKGI